MMKIEIHIMDFEGKSKAIQEKLIDAADFRENGLDFSKPEWEGFQVTGISVYEILNKIVVFVFRPLRKGVRAGVL